MSRDQETQVANTAGSQNATDFSESQTAEKGAQDTIAEELASNPYVQGGQYQTDQQKIATDTADAGSAATRTQLQTQAQRTGQNQTAADATALAGDQAAERAAAEQEATADASRIDKGAQYTGNVEQQEAGLAGQTGTQGNTALSVDQQASQQPSFLDEFGNSVASNLGKVAVYGAAGV